MQARDAIAWIERQGGPLRPGMSVLDLGCGHGVFGDELRKRGCQVTFADEGNHLLPGLAGADFRAINLDRDDVAGLGTHDLVICSNVFEHLAKPDHFLNGAATLLKPEGRLYLSWTNWLSPWGGHEFSPFHYLGPKLGCRVYDRLIGKSRLHTPGVNLFPTFIGPTLRRLGQRTDLEVFGAAPRYYPELAWLVRIPGLREFLTWNCALLIGHRPR